MLVSRHTPNRGYKWQDFSVQCTNDEAGEREREREREREIEREKETHTRPQ